MRNKLLFTPKDIKPSIKDWKIVGVLNPAAIRRKDGKILLMLRVAEQHPQHGKSMSCPIITSGDGFKTEKIHKTTIKGKMDNVLMLKDGTCRLTTISHVRQAILSKDGFYIESIDDHPTFHGTASEGQYGIEDPRITKIGDKYVMTYVAVSINEGVSTALAISKDLENWKRKGIVFREQNKDVVLFPEKINGKYVALHRPEGFFEFSKPSIWVSYSPDLVYWGREKSIIQPRENSWESERIGGGTPPIKTKAGWLEIYHGVKKVRDRNVYSAGAVLLDKKNPEKILARSRPNKPLFFPKEKFEKKGFVSNTVFPTGIVPDGKDLLIYYGAADSVVAVKKLKLKNILNSMEYFRG
ncbi:glycoside hydrolase family 130 protein [Nanoarchaeota archaeon]